MGHKCKYEVSHCLSPYRLCRRFPPSSTPRVSSSLNMVNELELGVTEPLGVFDPLGWLTTQPESFERRRAVERKHGRIAMAAVVGNIVHNNHIVFDGYISPSNDL